MAQTFEYPPALVQHRLLSFERSHRATNTFPLAHHYMLTRLKLAVKHIFRDEPTEYLMRGLHRELVTHFSIFWSFLTHIADQFSHHPW
jgi:hypothetical protein